MVNLMRRQLFRQMGESALALSVLTPLGALWSAGNCGASDDVLRTARDQIRHRYFADVTLTTHEGKRVRFYEDLLRDKIVTINFIYATCGDVCPVITANLARVQRLLGDRVGRDIFMYSISLKPELDTPAVLKQYAEAHGVGPGWSLLTGVPGDIDLLRRKLGFVDPDPVVDADPLSHIGNVRYGNEALSMWAACPGLASPPSIARAIQLVQKYAGGHRVTDG